MKELILGIGNTLKGDDGIGVHVVERINEYLKKVDQKSKQVKSAGTKREIIAINCGTAPENYTSSVREHVPDRLILVDAAEMGLSPGSYRIIPPEKIGVMCVSTHNMPLSLFVSYVSEFCRGIVLIGIQPERMDVGATLSSAVRSGGEDVANLIMEERLNEIEIIET
ncbi:MAG: hydrogenase maturation peptidase HycI [Dehalococcoidia bacterium]|nr:hydrogenase maturation peptidase HycI [Dehalococcoidia bacterium]